MFYEVEFPSLARRFYGAITTDRESFLPHKRVIWTICVIFVPPETAITRLNFT